MHEVESAIDVVVIGSGAAGMTAAITAALSGRSVALVEKASQIGGTSAWSGGAAWLPCHHHMAKVGLNDSPDRAETYIRNVVGDHFDAAKVSAFLRNGPRMLQF